MKSIDVAPNSIGLIDVLADAIFRFIVDSEVALDRRGKMLDELFRRAAPQYGVNWNGKTFGQAGQEKSDIMRKNNIRPGDAEWFKLWFSLPYMTGEKPHESK